MSAAYGERTPKCNDLMRGREFECWQYRPRILSSSQIVAAEECSATTLFGSAANTLSATIQEVTNSAVATFAKQPRVLKACRAPWLRSLARDRGAAGWLCRLRSCHR